MEKSVWEDLFKSQKEFFWSGQTRDHDFRIQAASHFLPFGGAGANGIGHYHGKASFETFTNFKGMVQSPGRFDPRLAHPDRNFALKLLKMILK